MPILVDLETVPDGIFNSCLCDMHKALAESPDGTDATIWDRHENPWAAELVEDVTAKLQRALRLIQEAFSSLLLGRPITELGKSDEPWLRWDQEAFEAVRRHLESLRPDQYTLDDWMMAAEYIIHRYLPDGVINTLADYMTVRAVLLGKISTCHPTLPPETIAEIPGLLPTGFAKMPPKVLTPVEAAILQVSKVRAGQYLGSVTDAQKHRMQGMICEHVQAKVLGQKEGTAQALRQRLFDSFGQMNRDFRRIAVTEVGECVNQGFISATGPGRKVRRLEAYRGACPFCKSISGKVFTIVPADTPNPNGQTEVWEGKTNIGRSASPRKRVGGSLMERGENERWWPAAGVQHVHCRGSWQAILETPPGVKPEFKKWMDEQLARTRRGEETEPFKLRAVKQG